MNYALQIAYLTRFRQLMSSFDVYEEQTPNAIGIVLICRQQKYVTLTAQEKKIIQ